MNDNIINILKQSLSARSKNIDAEFDRFQRTIDERDKKILALLESKKTGSTGGVCSDIWWFSPCQIAASVLGSADD